MEYRVVRVKHARTVQVVNKEGKIIGSFNSCDKADAQEYANELNNGLFKPRS